MKKKDKPHSNHIPKYLTYLYPKHYFLKKRNITDYMYTDKMSALFAENMCFWNHMDNMILVVKEGIYNHI